MKRTRQEDDAGFNSPAAKLAAKLGANITMAMGESLQFIEDTLAPCKTLSEFKRARAAIQQRCIRDTIKVASLAVKMADDGNKIMAESKKKE